GFVQNAAGAVPSPFDCYLVLRGLRTLGVRMDRHCDNARAVVELLLEHPAVERVLWPGLPDHPGADVAKRQMRDAGGMVSFVVRGGEDAAIRLVGRTRLFILAESLGSVESLIEHPHRMTHASAAGSALAVAPGPVRLAGAVPGPRRSGRHVTCRPNGGAARSGPVSVAARGHGRHHRRLRRGPPRPPPGGRGWGPPPRPAGGGPD